jgi:hypothetical protein
MGTTVSQRIAVISLLFNSCLSVFALPSVLRRSCHSDYLGDLMSDPSCTLLVPKHKARLFNFSLLFDDNGREYQQAETTASDLVLQRLPKKEIEM